jgi:3-deoxy-D-manno-octulosonate 8-phosphate phosphatase (KDO 8-P phosphatase)
VKNLHYGKRRREVLKNIEAIVFDFDGIFTNNKVIVAEDGKESVICNRADGLGIRMLQARRMPLLILSTETNPVVAIRAQKLALNFLQAISNKELALVNYCRENGIEIKNVMYVGNDLNDYEVMKAVGYPVAPKDAHPKIRHIAKYIINKNGGEGVIKELSERLLID